MKRIKESRLLWLFTSDAIMTSCPVPSDLTYLNAFYSKTPQKLSKYSGFGNVRLHHFRVPEDAVLVRWLLTVSRGSGLNCGNQNITVYVWWNYIIFNKPWIWSAFSVEMIFWKLHHDNNVIMLLGKSLGQLNGELDIMQHCDSMNCDKILKTSLKEIYRVL